MSKVVYVSYAESEGIMKSLGLDVVTITREMDFKQVIRQLKQADITVVFVSEEVYQVHETSIEQLNKTFEIAISILANQLPHAQLAQLRLKSLTQEVLGISHS